MDASCASAIERLRSKASTKGSWTLGDDRELIECVKTLGNAALERCARTIARVDDAARRAERAATETATTNDALRILANSQFLEQCVREDDDDGGRVASETSAGDADGSERTPRDALDYGDLADVARVALEATRGRWAETRDGGLALTGNKYWRPLPAVIGTTAYYRDESCGLDPFEAKNPNPARWGTYISSDDEDSSEVSDDSSDTLESDISSEFVSSTSSDGEYSDMDEHLADVENYPDAVGALGGGDAGAVDSGRDLFSSVGFSSLTKSAKKAVPSYALSLDDVFGDDVRSSGGLFEGVASTSADAALSPIPGFSTRILTPTGTAICSERPSVSRVGTCFPHRSKIHLPPTVEVGAISLAVPKARSPLLFDESDTDEESELFSTKASSGPKPSIKREGLFD
ncbi:hypothetical protein BE221DRAFT_76866 [Ostreococcus tauri]|uniref:Uncharacterized protein n=1 Tax=Ostreococcus tauri TaxID=70448 RepID=A0A1Y5I714_OSTTA|nr:hypothetical protein BE221DRAFT_76866 [Ostreococcus tauri]